MADRSERARRPFWLHQAVEYLLGIVLVMQGLQMPEPLVPAAAGVLVLLNAATAIGPLSAFRLAGRRAHRIADLVVIAVIVALSVQPWLSIDAGNRGLMLVVAAVLGVVWWYTDFAEKAERAQRRAAAAGPRSEAIGRSAGRLAGGAVSGWRRRNR
jgi:hypothetical protein